LAIVLMGGAVVAMPTPSGAAVSITLERVEAADGSPADGTSQAQLLADDGSWLLFDTGAANLFDPPDPDDGAGDVARRDLGTGTSAVLSVLDSGEPTLDFCDGGDLDGTGTVVAMSCGPPGLSGVPTISDHVYVRGATGTAELVSVSDEGVPGNAYAHSPQISADARYVAFTTASDNLVDVLDENGDWDVFLRDRSNDTTTLLSDRPDGEAANSSSEALDMASDTGAVLFHTSATDLVGDGVGGLFVSTIAGVVERVSLSTSGTPVPGMTSNGAISDDGRYVAFHTSVSLSPTDTDAGNDVYVRDRVAGTTTLVSVSSAGVLSNGTDTDADISDDGRYVVFESNSTNLVAGDTSTKDIFRHDRTTGETIRISQELDGTKGNGSSRDAIISGDGGTVAFESTATNLTAGPVQSSTQLFVWSSGGGTCDLSFSDVPDDHPFYADICWSVEQQVVTGYPDNTFRPTNPVTRQALVTFLWRLAGEPAGPFSAHDLTDVPPAEPFHTAIEWAIDENVVGGYEDDTFRPTVPVSRQAMVVFLWRRSGQPSGPFSPSGLTDLPAPGTFRTAIEWAVANGIVNGYADDTFRGTNSVSRQAVVAFLHRWADL